MTVDSAPVKGGKMAKRGRGAGPRPGGGDAPGNTDDGALTLGRNPGRIMSQCGHDAWRAGHAAAPPSKRDGFVTAPPLFRPGPANSCPADAGPLPESRGIIESKNMKNVLFASAAVAALALAAPALAQSQPVGSVGASYSHSEVELGGLEADGDLFAVDGVVAFEAGDAWTVTFDGAVTYDDDAVDDEFSLVGTGHLSRELGDARVGGFVGLADAGDETLVAGGFEAEKYMGDVTLAGMVGYGQIDDVDADLWGARGEVRYFVSDNFRLDGGLGLARVDAAGAEADLWSVGVGGEYQFAGTPWSLTAGYSHAEADDFDVSADTLSVGVRYSFGGDLRARDRAGAGLGGVNKLFGLTSF